MASPPTTSSKAWCYNNKGYPSALHLAEVPVATTPESPHHVIVKVHAAALNPVDIQLMNLPLWGLPLPFAPFSTQDKQLGEDFAGTILAVGSEASSSFAVGDEVMGITMAVDGSAGTLKEIASINTKASAVVKIPKNNGWSWQQSASLPLVWLTARTCIEQVRVSMEKSQSKNLAVLGASSSTGMYVAYQAKARGWNVLGTCSSRNADFAKGMGAAQVCDYTTQSVPDTVRSFKPDAIIDCVGGTECLSLSNRYVTIVGDKTTRSSMGGVAIYLWNPQMVLRHLLGRAGLGVWYDCINLSPSKEWLEEASDLPKDKVIVDSKWSYSQGKEAYERLNTSRARGKVVLKVVET